jgi:DNA-binding phage protein
MPKLKGYNKRKRIQTQINRQVRDKHGKYYADGFEIKHSNVVSARRSVRLSAEDFMERVREKDVCFLCAGSEVTDSEDQEDISSVDIYAIRRPYFTIADLIDDDDYVDIFTDDNMCDDVNDDHVTRIRNVLYKPKGEASGVRGAGNSRTSFYRSKAMKMELQKSANGSADIRRFFTGAEDIG